MAQRRRPPVTLEESGQSVADLEEENARLRQAVEELESQQALVSTKTEQADVASEPSAVNIGVSVSEEQLTWLREQASANIFSVIPIDNASFSDTCDRDFTLEVSHLAFLDNDRMLLGFDVFNKKDGTLKILQNVNASAPYLTDELGARYDFVRASDEFLPLKDRPLMWRRASGTASQVRLHRLMSGPPH